jgi:predicted Rossmann-fold nucleotide-binding protein
VVILVCGGRKYKDRYRLYSILNKLHKDRGIDKLVQGGGTGADELAKQWAKTHGVPVETYDADWDNFGNPAGPMRNQRMLDEEKPDAVIGFPGGVGTADMLRRAKAAYIKIWQIQPV